MAKKTQKTSKRAAARTSKQKRSPASKKSGSASQRAAARKPERSQAAGSGLVYTDLLREALARRRSQGV